MAKKRKALSSKASKRVFQKGSRINRKNIPAMPMRGGIRL